MMGLLRLSRESTDPGLAPYKYTEGNELGRESAKVPKVLPHQVSL